MFDSNLFNTITAALLALSGWEVVAALFGVAYVVLAARESQWCWPLAFVSTLIYTIIFWEGQLPMQALLNLYYMGMAVYGYLLWRKQTNTVDFLPISSWGLSRQLPFIMLGSVLTYAVGLYLTQLDISQSPYLDAGVTVFSVMNTWLMAKKVLQNWIYWVVIDAAAIVLYAQNGYYATVVMYFVYLILAIIGFISWKKLLARKAVT